jgi:hypothetical protein
MAGEMALLGNDLSPGLVERSIDMEYVFWILYLAVIVLMIAGMWKVFEKAGKPGWAAVIPIYNVIVLLEIAGRPAWWIVVILLVPCVNIVFAILLYIDVAKAFGKDAGWGIGLLFLGFVFFPLLGFGDAKYIGPPARSA